MLKLLASAVSFRVTNAISHSQPMIQFMNSSSNQLKLIPALRKSTYGNRVAMPRKNPSKLEIQCFFEQNRIQNKQIIMDVDPSHLIGVKRTLMLEHLMKNIYKGNSQPLDLMTKQNPVLEVSMEEIYFDADMFFLTEPKYAHLFKDDSGMSEQQADNILQEYYDAHPQRGVQRLRAEYKIPDSFLQIIQTAHNFQNKIYFGGINQYELRNILWLFHPLEQLKNMFIMAMHHWKQHPSFQKQQYEMADFQNSCRQYIQMEDYKVIQTFRSRRLKQMRAKIPHAYCFAHTYAFAKTDMTQLKILMEKPSPKDTQHQKMEKHAIMEVMLGDLWSQNYTKNKFPYLSEYFPNLSKADQEAIQGIYNKNYNVYKTAVDKFRLKYYTSQKT